MSSSTIETLRSLRERTGAGIIACRNALAEAQGDTERAAGLLKAQEHALAQAKQQRVATQGMVGLRVSNRQAMLVEVNCESDFVARSAAFMDGVAECAQLAPVQSGTLEANAAVVLTSLSARTGERVLLRRTHRVVLEPEQVVGTYVHGGNNRDIGRIAVVVVMRVPATPDGAALARGIAMHIAASAPTWTSTGDVPGEVLAAKRAEFEAEAVRTGKAALVVSQIVEGRLRKHAAQTTLLGQAYALNPDVTVQEVLQAASDSWGVTVAVEQYVRFEVGDAESRRPD